MIIAELENLVRVKQLKREPCVPLELERMLAMAQKHLEDARRESNSLEGRFLSAYSVGHTAGLAALRWHGYRSENRYQVFQALPHTIGWSPAKWRQLDSAHNKRNVAEYEGFLDVEKSQVETLIALVTQLLQEVSVLVKQPPPKSRHTT